jgi:hypothetical protein
VARTGGSLLHCVCSTYRPRRSHFFANEMQASEGLVHHVAVWDAYFALGFIGHGPSDSVLCV